jgi:hypothetical protein
MERICLCLFEFLFFQIFNFELDADDMKKLDSLDTGKEGTFGFDWSSGLKGYGMLNCF